ncbi:MAG: hypothetical protein M3132_07135 [Actinomycetia bacterium]|nr:hypothetical protein [Actinomycetes bacterium]
MNTRFATDTKHDVEVAPELAGLNLVDKPDGPAAAAMLSAGIGIFMLGFFTTGAVISASLKSFLAWWEWGQGVGPLAGKSTVAVIIWLVSWAVLYFVWKDKDVDLKKMFYIGLGLGLLGALGMFPPFFELFHS